MHGIDLIKSDEPCGMAGSIADKPRGPSETSRESFSGPELIMRQLENGHDTIEDTTLNLCVFETRTIIFT